MLARTLTPKTIEKLNGLTGDQIMVLHHLARGLSVAAIEAMPIMQGNAVSRAVGQVRKILGADAESLYREYGRSLGFTDDGKGALLQSKRVQTKKERVLCEDPMPDPTIVAERLSELPEKAKMMVGKIREGVDIESVVEVCHLPKTSLNTFLPVISRAFGIIPRGGDDKVRRWRMIETKIRELDFSCTDL